MQRALRGRHRAAWAERVDALRPSAGMRVGAAIHSVRAVPAAAIEVVAAARPADPLHVHLSEQPAENDACRADYGCTPTELLARHGALGPRTTAVHATHLTAGDVARSAGPGPPPACARPPSGTWPTGSARPGALADAGSPLALGSDQHAVVDLLEEARAVEMHERLASLRRGRFHPGRAAGRADPARGARLGRRRSDRAGRPGRPGRRRARLPRTAGSAPDQVVLTATAADVRTVLVDGEVVVRDGRHRLGDVGRLLVEAIGPLWD